MSRGTAARTTDDRPYSTLGVDAVDLDRYAGVAFVDGEVYVYDTEAETAWIQSDAGVEVVTMR